MRLLAAGLVPERGGSPVHALAHISLADLMVIQGSSALLAQWTDGLRARWAGHRAAAAEAGGHQGVWVDGAAAEGIACDAAVTPVVTGDLNADAFEDLVRLCVHLDRLRHGASQEQPAEVPAGFAGKMSRRAVEQAIIGKAVELLSGPGGVASFLRRQQLGGPLGGPLGGRLAGPSLPLDIGYAATVPAHIRKAVKLRAGGRCEWAGRCGQPAAGCEVHHTTHKADGGKTSVTDCVLLCTYHHQVMIHRLGWTLVVNPDGTTTAWNKDKTKVLHSHGPPARAG